jgi:hypothetical protein
MVMKVVMQIVVRENGDACEVGWTVVVWISGSPGVSEEEHDGSGAVVRVEGRHLPALHTHARTNDYKRRTSSGISTIPTSLTSTLTVFSSCSGYRNCGDTPRLLITSAAVTSEQ